MIFDLVGIYFTGGFGKVNFKGRGRKRKESKKIIKICNI
jgi:hypothetical protein